jgi:hypothetical protein
MKNKPYPALLRPSNLSNEIGKRVPKSRETIPLKMAHKTMQDPHLEQCSGLTLVLSNVNAYV